MLGGRRREVTVVRPEDALPGRDQAVALSGVHFVHGRAIMPPWPEGHEVAVLGMGCFWGAERILWQLPGVHTTFVGYAGGTTPNPTYREVCTGMTGHAEVAVAVYDPSVTSFEAILAPFWEQHDPTQHMRQGNDVGTQYRSTILVTSPAQEAVALRSRAHYQDALSASGHGSIATTIEPLGPLFYAEEEHQQYLAKNPGGYCNHGFCQAPYVTSDGGR
jgi:peptide-methionine (S)-S-oxide reductase